MDWIDRYGSYVHGVYGIPKRGYHVVVVVVVPVIVAVVLVRSL